jgi:hypothetical protein
MRNLVKYNGTKKIISNKDCMPVTMRYHRPEDGEKLKGKSATKYHPLRYELLHEFRQINNVNDTSNNFAWDVTQLAWVSESKGIMM